MAARGKAGPKVLPANDIKPGREQAEDAVRTLLAWAGDDPGREGVGRALEELAQYAEYHFGAEEKLMKQHRCAGLADQQAAHGQLINQVRVLREQFAAGQQGLGVEVLGVLKDWLINHIQRKDKPCMVPVCAAKKRAARLNSNGQDGNGNGHAVASLPSGARTNGRH